jgi:hypothetical protein
VLDRLHLHTATGEAGQQALAQQAEISKNFAAAGKQGVEALAAGQASGVI